MEVKNRCSCEDYTNYHSEFGRMQIQRAIQGSIGIEGNNRKMGRVDDFDWPQLGTCGMENGESNWTGQQKWSTAFGDAFSQKPGL